MIPLPVRLPLSLLAVALVSNPLRAKEEKSLEAQVKDLAQKVEALEYDLDQRSPIWNVQKLKLPLMVTSTTNDRDVVEVEQLIAHLKAGGKSFEHKIYNAAPGGHSFERIDTTYVRNVRKDLYTFLGKHLK